MNEQANPRNDKAVQTGHIQTGCQDPLAKKTAVVSPNALKQSGTARSCLCDTALQRLWGRQPLCGSGCRGCVGRWPQCRGSPCCPPRRAPSAQGPACLQLPSAALTQLSLCSCALIFQLTAFLPWPFLLFPRATYYSPAFLQFPELLAPFSPGLLIVSSQLPGPWQIIPQALPEPLAPPASRCCCARSSFCTRCRWCTATETKKNQRFVGGRCWTINEINRKLSSVSSCKYSNSFNFLPSKIFVCELPRTNHHNESAVNI